MPKIMTADEAALLLHSGDTVLFNGFGSLGFPEGLSEAVGRRFAASGQPRDLEMIFSAGQGVWNEERMVEHMCQPGMVRKVVGGHITPNLRICQQLQNNEIEGYNFSMGVISHLIRESAGGHPGLVTKIGLKTFIDPRYGGGALNERSKAEMVKLIELDGEEYLFYPAIRPSVAILRGTTCDPNGNITMEKEAVIGDAYHCALAARRTGGRVIVQVERLTDAPAHPRSVVIPGVFVDAVVVDPGQLQTMIEAYDPAYTGEIRVPQDQVLPLIEHVNDLNVQAGRKRERGPLHQVIARRAAMELTSGALVNLGIGIPELIPQGAKDLGLPGDITLTVESGCIGGVPAPGISFGAAVNPHMVQDMASQFDLYDGGLLDMTFVGAMQVGQDGSVNVSKAGSRIIGVGGFTDLTQSARKLTYCFPFSSGGLEVEIRDGAVKILKEGKWPKFCRTLDQISASGPYSLEIGQQVLYITERCVFDLTSQGLRLIEIAPGVDLERDILSRMPYRPVLAEELKPMDPRLFQGL